MALPYHLLGGSSASGFNRSLLERSIAKRSADGFLTVPQAFLDLLKAIEPTPPERTEASEQQQRVRDKLHARLWLLNTFLSGSYRRHTLPRPVTDIDLLALLDAAKHGITLDGTGATKALDLTLAALDDAYKNTEKQREPRCIVMQFAGTGIGFDIVPVVQFAEHEFWLPDESLGRWIRTNPREVQRLVSEANQQVCDEWLVPLVKLLKMWKRHCSVPLRGFHLEALAYFALQHAPRNEREGLQFLFEQLQTAVWFPTPDIWPDGEPASTGLSLTDQIAAAAMLADAAKVAREANEAEAAGRTNEAHAKWYSLFGDVYPETGAERTAALRAPLREALSIVKEGRPFTATSSGIMPVTAGFASVRSATSHGGLADLTDAGHGRGASAQPTASVAPEQVEHLEAEIARARSQFSDLQRVDVAAAIADPRLWPVKAGDEDSIYAVLVGRQGTNYGTSHEILVTVPRDMPATEPRIYMLRQHVDGVPVSRRGGVHFAAKRAIKHQWRDRAMCTHALRDRWDGRLVTALVYAADWLFRQQHYRLTKTWIGHEIDGRRRHLVNGRVVGQPPKPRTPVKLRRGARR